MNLKQREFMKQSILERVDERLRIFELNQKEYETIDIISNLTEKELEEVKQYTEDEQGEKQ